MEKKRESLPISIAALVCALLGYFLRRMQLAGSSDAAVIVWSVVIIAAAFVYALSAQRERDYARLFVKGYPDLLCSGLGVVMILIACLLSISGNAGIGRLIAIIGAVSSLALLRAAALRWKGEAPSAFWHAPILIYYFAKLFLDYRKWMIDPAILDYCFQLFAMLCFLLASYHAAAFSFDRGNRRALLFFSAVGVCFGSVALADADLAQTLLYGGSVLCMFAYLWQAGARVEPCSKESEGASQE